MAYDEQSQHGAEPEQDEPVLVVGMIRIVDQQSLVVEKYALRLLEGNAVLALIRSVLGSVPMEPQVAR